MTEDQITPLADGGDPDDFTVDQVNAYLADLDPEGDERRRVLDAEQGGQARVGILGKPDENGNRPTDPEPETLPSAPPATTKQSALVEQLDGETTDVVLLQHWNDKNGKAHVPGERLTVDSLTALTLLGTRWAEPVGEGDSA